MRVQGWTQHKYYKACLLTEPCFQDFSHLGCEYVCDMFSRMEDERLDFVCKGKLVEAAHFAGQARKHGLEIDEDGDDDEDNQFTSLHPSQAHPNTTPIRPQIP